MRDSSAVCRWGGTAGEAKGNVAGGGDTYLSETYSELALKLTLRRYGGDQFSVMGRGE